MPTASEITPEMLREFYRELGLPAKPPTGYGEFLERMHRAGGLQDHCDRLRGSHTGMADPMSDKDVAETRAYLHWKLATWRNPTDDYDLAVKRLCEVSLRDYHADRCDQCGGKRATEADMKRAHDTALPDEPLPWEAALCWAHTPDGPHASPALRSDMKEPNGK